METRSVTFVVGLSNGENYQEGFGFLEIRPGELSPWQRLSKYLIEKNLRITSLALKSIDNRYFVLDSAGKNPKFVAFGKEPHPIDYNFYRTIGADINLNNGEDKFAVIEALYDGFRLQVWVDENNFNSWVNVVWQ